MQHKSSETMERIRQYVNEYFIAHHSSPSLRNIAEAIGVSYVTVQRYLVAMNENGVLRYDGRTIRSGLTDKVSDMRSVAVLGRVSCGPLEVTEENTEDIIPLPSDWLGNGEYFAVRASGTSMIKVGIRPGDLVIIEKDAKPHKKDIIVALDDQGQTTLKRYMGVKNGCAILHPENDDMEDIQVKSPLSCQGVARFVLKDLSQV